MEANGRPTARAGCQRIDEIAHCSPFQQLCFYQVKVGTEAHGKYGCNLQYMYCMDVYASIDVFLCDHGEGRISPVVAPYAMLLEFCCLGM